MNSNYMYCHSPESDVVEKAIPFSVSLNSQQNTPQPIDFWYYNRPSITKLTPNRGPDDGGNEIILQGNNFDPFINYHPMISNYNDTFCNFEGLTLVPANVISSTRVSCKAPPSYVLRETHVEITLNN